MENRFEYYIFNKRIYAYDTSSSFAIYWEENAWHEDCNIKIDELIKGNRITSEQALKETNNNDPTSYVDELIEQDMLKNIYCP